MLNGNIVINTTDVPLNLAPVYIPDTPVLNISGTSSIVEYPLVRVKTRLSQTNVPTQTVLLPTFQDSELEDNDVTQLRWPYIRSETFIPSSETVFTAASSTPSGSAGNPESRQGARRKDQNVGGTDNKGINVDFYDVEPDSTFLDHNDTRYSEVPDNDLSDHEVSALPSLPNQANGASEHELSRPMALWPFLAPLLLLLLLPPAVWWLLKPEALPPPPPLPPPSHGSW